MLRFQDPKIANDLKISKHSIHQNPDQPVYVHAEFLKPGKQVYCIKYDGDQERSLSHRQQF